MKFYSETDILRPYLTLYVKKRQKKNKTICVNKSLWVGISCLFISVRTCFGRYRVSGTQYLKVSVTSSLDTFVQNLKGATSSQFQSLTKSITGPNAGLVNFCGNIAQNLFERHLLSNATASLFSNNTTTITANFMIFQSLVFALQLITA
jgi:hypothetical protein